MCVAVSKNIQGGKGGIDWEIFYDRAVMIIVFVVRTNLQI